MISFFLLWTSTWEFRGKERFVGALGHIRTRVGFGSLEGKFAMIVICIQNLDSELVMRVHETKECHGLFVSNKKCDMSRRRLNSANNSSFHDTTENSDNIAGRGKGGAK